MDIFFCWSIDKNKRNEKVFTRKAIEKYKYIKGLYPLLLILFDSLSEYEREYFENKERLLAYINKDVVRGYNFKCGRVFDCALEILEN